MRDMVSQAIARQQIVKQLFIKLHIKDGSLEQLMQSKAKILTMPIDFIHSFFKTFYYE